MSFVEDVDAQVHAETRALLIRGHWIEPSSEELADAIFAWTVANGGGKIGEMALQLVAHGEDLASEWDERPFLVGIVLREVFGLGGDHELGLTDEELAARVARADARLDELATSFATAVKNAGATMRERKTYFSWSGPLCSAQLVKGVRRESAEDEEYYWSVGEGQPGYFFARCGSSQTEAPIGAFGLEIAHGYYDNSDAPVEVTPELLASRDAALVEHGISGASLYVFPHYD